MPGCGGHRDRRGHGGRPTWHPGPPGPARAGPLPNFGARRGGGCAAWPPAPARPPPPQHPGREVKQPGAGSCTLHSGRRAASIPAPPGSAKAHFFALICTFSTSRAPVTLPGLSPLSGLITLRSPPHPTANSRSPSLLPPPLLQGLLRSSPMESRERKRKREAEGREGSRSIPPSPPPRHTRQPLSPHPSPSLGNFLRSSATTRAPRKGSRTRQRCPPRRPGRRPPSPPPSRPAAPRGPPLPRKGPPKPCWVAGLGSSAPSSSLHLSRSPTRSLLSKLCFAE